MSSLTSYKYELIFYGLILNIIIVNNSRFNIKYNYCKEQWPTEATKRILIVVEAAMEIAEWNVYNVMMLNHCSYFLNVLLVKASY